jgi:hypothetical protein
MKKFDHEQTQSQIKFKQYLEDLRRNEDVIARAKKMRVVLDFERVKLPDPEEKSLIEGVREKRAALDAAVKALLAKRKGKGDDLINEFSKKYLGLEFKVILGLVYDFFLQDGVVDVGRGTDFCTISERYGEHFKNRLPRRRRLFELDAYEQTHIRAFPVSIDLHRFATKRDVLDFIEKRWGFIEEALAKNGSERKRFRQRKLNRKLTDFIWERRDLSREEIASEVKKEFPNSGLMYYEISKIISDEKRRRLGKLT